ncbi:hypothetical protein H7F10_01465 [Acidithiobacillus sp. HP-6]|uniref:hypothetical protein n=1 Tax=unclassified Acidithiobacillus TaxID=2614800 RepID=UPI001879B1FF|nr:MULTISPECIES: hypothetical protein [unclassified Acidithiobacillus]MBE7561654.1 hypothetical protein [Acidithiobacillus sp. HP-6]MBE7568432.1 hypothetical protein [Acidithiobacillus sp. HP-2]
MMNTFDVSTTSMGVIYRKRVFTAYHLLRPQTLLLAAVVLMLMFTLVPPTFYEHTIHEPDLMFANPVLFIFLITCATIVLLGIRVGYAIAYRMPPRLATLVRVPAFVYLMLPTVAALGLLLITIATILRNDPAILALALSGEGQQVKLALSHASRGAMMGSLPLAMGVMWWVWANYLRLSLRINRLGKFMLVFLVGSLMTSLFLSALLMMSRFVLMPAIFGFFLIYLRHAVLMRGVRVSGILLRGLMIMTLLLVLFGGVAVLRSNIGYHGHDALLTSFIGYGPTSINHLAGYLDGRFPSGLLKQSVLPNDFGFIYQFPFADRFFPTASLSFAQAFKLSFRVTYDAGLNGNYTWFTSWGQILAGTGWFAPLYLLLYGFFFARAWRGFTAGGTSGMLLYPWFAFNVLFTFGANFAASNFLSILVLLSIWLYMYSGLVRISS